jgi:signal transduction histidine kinase
VKLRTASVGHRLFFLVICQTAIAVLLVLLAHRAIAGAAADYSHMLDFQIKSIADIRSAMDRARTLEDGVPSLDLQAFYTRYRTEWETASGTTPDAIHFRNDLEDAGVTELLRRETEVVEQLGHHLHDGSADAVRRDLNSLYDINVTYAKLENQYILGRLRTRETVLAGVGLAGISTTFLLGLHVQRAISPRVKQLVEHIRHFQEYGWSDRLTDTGNDDISILANAVDIGFSAIASRERDRDQFLSIVAHELKTPVTSIYGYSSLLMNNSVPAAEGKKAVEAIHRQAWRLSRLIEAVFLLGKARSGELPFQPKPLNMSELIELVVHEMEPLFLNNIFNLQVDHGITVLGDEVLLEHALWALFASASAFSKQDSPLHVCFYRVHNRARLTVDIKERDISTPELEELFMPFRYVEYETGRGLRSSIGLYLCREIVRVHNGTLKVEQLAGLPPEFVMELPA